MTHNQIEYAKLKEQVRSNQASESELQRYHDLSIELGYAQLAETARGNTLNYQVGMANVAARREATAVDRELGLARQQLNEAQFAEDVYRYQDSGRAKVLSGIELTNAQAKVNRAQAGKVYHEIANVDANINLTNAQTGKVQEEIVKTRVSTLESMASGLAKVGQLIAPLLVG